MTINIGLFDRQSVHVGADFRLLNADSGKEISDRSPKIVVFRERCFTPDDWTGVVTYCGVGRWRSRDTSQWLGDWIQKAATPRNFTSIASAIEREGTAWLDEIRRHAKYDGAHTFMLLTCH